MSEDQPYKVENIGMRKKTIENFLNEQYAQGWELVNIDYWGSVAVFKKKGL